MGTVFFVQMFSMGDIQLIRLQSNVPELKREREYVKNVKAGALYGGANISED